MKKEVISLNYKNNLSDAPNNFIRMIYKLSSKYEMSISEVKGFSSINRNFYAELVGRKSYIRIEFDYEEQKLSYSIESEYKDEIEKYIINGVTKVNYKVGDIVNDEYGNQCTILKDTEIPEDSNKAFRVFVKTSEGITKEFIDIMISQL
ncbi:hypothetical protein [uncultured Clostridium sp.]|uniref:hypothetical protein n=1 Tax=uncultured Clostridium sp. TaxID=59620 RepID=UPI00321626D4